MLGKNKVKLILSLQKKRARDQEKLFIIEGDKIVREFLVSGMKVAMLVAKPEFISGLPSELISLVSEVIPVSYEELKKLSTLKTPHNALALVRMPEAAGSESDFTGELCAALDFIQDPGNLGTIIRAAAWFGIRNIICSENCVDAYNPKVIQATMGAILNVRVTYLDLAEFLVRTKKSGSDIYGTLLDGESVYGATLGKTGVILLGNESKGISDNLVPLITKRISIPKFTMAVHGIDSLNAGMAASIVFSEFARRRH